MSQTDRNNQSDSGEGESRKEAAHALLEARRSVYVRRARRALLGRLLVAGTASADDVADRLGTLPGGIDPRFRGTVPGPLARLGIIRDTGRAIKSSRPETHARKVTVWELADLDAALAWLARNPDLETPSSAFDVTTDSNIFQHEDPSGTIRRASYDQRS